MHANCREEKGKRVALLLGGGLVASLATFCFPAKLYYNVLFP